ncbi:MAG: hypothetical protein AABZ30_14675 [Myxococcota bacterium]
MKGADEPEDPPWAASEGSFPSVADSAARRTLGEMPLAAEAAGSIEKDSGPSSHTGRIGVAVVVLVAALVAATLALRSGRSSLASVTDDATSAAPVAEELAPKPKPAPRLPLRPARTTPAPPRPSATPTPPAKGSPPSRSAPARPASQDAVATPASPSDLQRALERAREIGAQSGE